MGYDRTGVRHEEFNFSINQYIIPIVFLKFA